MSKPKIDLENLRRVIQMGAAEACRDAGIKSFTVECAISAIPRRSGAGVELVPDFKICVVELDDAQAKVIAALHGIETGDGTN